MFWKLLHAAAGVSVVIIGAMTLLGYLLDHAWLMRWTGNVPMAVNTALAFLILGIAEICESVAHAKKP